MSDEDTAVLLQTEKKTVENEETTDPKPETYQNTAQDIRLDRSQSIFCSVSTVISGVVFGYDLGVSSNLIKPLSSVLELSCTQHFYVVSCWLLGVFLSAICGGYIIDTLGRRGSITVSMIMLLVSSMLMSMPSWEIFLPVFLISRFISGFAGPLSAISQFVYLSEISEPEHRGFRISLHPFGMALGGLVACIPVFFAENYSGWRLCLMQYVGFHACWVIYITLYWLPPSPHSTHPEHLKAKKKKTRSYRIDILMETIGIAMFLVEVQQLCGRYTVLYYVPRLLLLLGFCSGEAARISVSAFAIIKFFAIGLCLLIVDRIGRRMSLIMSSTIMMTCLSLLALLASIDDPEMTPSPFFHDNCDHMSSSDSPEHFTDVNPENWRPDNPDAPWALPKSPPPYPMLPTPLSLVSSRPQNCPDVEVVSALSPTLRVVGIVAVILYQVADVLGYGTVTWIVLSEIFPTMIRGRCMCAITMIFWMDIGAPSMFMQLGSTIGSTFLIYSFICLGSIIITYMFIPETKNKTLQQIAQDLRNISLVPRVYENLNSLPFVGNSQWLKRRMQNLPANGSTII